MKPSDLAGHLGWYSSELRELSRGGSGSSDPSADTYSGIEGIASLSDQLAADVQKGPDLDPRVVEEVRQLCLAAETLASKCPDSDLADNLGNVANGLQARATEHETLDIQEDGTWRYASQ